MVSIAFCGFVGLAHVPQTIEGSSAMLAPSIPPRVGTWIRCALGFLDAHVHVNVPSQPGRKKMSHLRARGFAQLGYQIIALVLAFQSRTCEISCMQKLVAVNFWKPSPSVQC